MQVAFFSFSGWGAGLTSVGILAAIIVLACVLGAEIAGICILVNKMLKARRARIEQEIAEENEENSSYHYHHGAIGAALLMGAVPQTSYRVLTILATLTALAALVFLVLVIVFRACGYDFTATGRVSKRKDEEDYRYPEALPEEEPIYAVLPDDEEQAQEAYTPIAEETEEEAQSEEELPEEEIAEDAPLVAAEEEPVEDGETELAIAPAAVNQTITETTVREEPVFSDGTHPYKVVEKVVKETVKEVYRENPAPAPQETEKSGTDAVMEKLADFLEYELQKRKESDAAEAEEEKEDSLPTIAEIDPIDEEEEEDEDEIEEENEESRDEDDDLDDEENDTEGDHFTGSERIIGFDEETGCYIVAHYRKSFEAKLIQSRSNIKQYYSEIKNALLSYGGTKSRMSWAADSFSNERTPIAKINVKTRTLELYLALDPASLEEDAVYKGQDVGNKKKYADTPFRYKIRSPRKLKWALELVQRTCEEHGLSPIDAEQVNYEELYPFDTTENLVERKLIKEYIRQEKPATTFELAPDHVPDVPAEDDSVIPANANFSWEFDNEVMDAEPAEEPIAEEPTEEPIPEPAPEPVPEPAPTPTAEPAPASGPSIFRETVKVTEMRYTERYYAGTEPTYEQVITTEEPVSALSAPMTADFEDHTEPTQEEELLDPVVETVAVPTIEDVDTEIRLDTTDEAVHDPFSVYDDIDESREAREIVEESTFDTADAFDEAPVDQADESEETFDPLDEEVDGSEELDEADVADDALDVTEDEVLDDEEATEYIVESEPIEEQEAPAPAKVQTNPAIAVVDLAAIEEHFSMGAVIDLESLKAKDLVLPSATTLKVYTSGPISKTFTVEANHFTLDAIQAITDADGDSVMVR